MAARAAFGEQSALLVANPLPPADQLDPQVFGDALADALAAAASSGVRGKAVTPFLLDRIQQVTGGASVAVNLDHRAGQRRRSRRRSPGRGPNAPPSPLAASPTARRVVPASPTAPAGSSSAVT